MERNAMAPAHPLLALSWAAAIVAIGGCPSEYEIKDIEDDASTVEYTNECDQFCQNEAPYVLGDCLELACGVNAGGAAVSGVINVLEAGPNGTCQLVVECPAGTCYDEYVQCLQDNANVDACNEAYYACVLEEECQADRSECESQAEYDYDVCQSTYGDDCDFWYEYDMEYCGCLYDECVRQVDLECGGLAQFAPPPAPVQTAPSRWTVTRRLIDQEIARLPSLDAETGAWPVAKDGHWAGVRLRSLQSDDILRILGLRNNDVITEINGIGIGDALLHPEWLLSLRDGDSIVVRVRRGGATPQLRYDIVP